jgi:probable phosphoglycerate mutase
MGRMTGSRTVFLVRHGAVATVHGRTYVGQAERPLTEEGLRQVLRLRVMLENAPIANIYCSDLSRSMRTAEIVAEDRAIGIRVCRDLREINLGAWEGRSFAEIARRFPDEFKARGEDLVHWRPPDGESFGDLRARVLPLFHSLLESSHGNLLIAGHAGVNRVILCDALGIPLANLFRIGQDYGCLNAIGYGSSGCRIQLLNYTPWGMPAEVGADHAVRELMMAE